MTNREIDKLVAEKIMGLTVVAFPSTTPPQIDYGIGAFGEDGMLPYYSTSMEAALNVMQQFNNLNLEQAYGQWHARWTGEIKCDRCQQHYVPSYNVVESTAPLAICLAALKIKGIEVKSIKEEQ